jgi:hypothetical protein
VNCTTYLFGELSSGYSQYPEDSFSNIFKEIYSQCTAPSQLIIHRDDSMMYYIYIRKIDSKRYIGIAIAVNGYYFTQINTLFSLFEGKIGQLAEQGVIINYSKNGDLDTTLSSLIDEEEEVIGFINSLQSEVSSIKSVKHVPQMNFAVSITSQKIFNENDTNSEIIKASYTFGYTIILKQENYDTLRSTSYRNTLKQLNTQNEVLTKTVEQLKETNKQILRQKKQFRKVVFLFIAVIACGIGIYCLNDNLNNTQDELNSANDTINRKNALISAQKDSISDLNDWVESLNSTLDKEKIKNTELSSKLNNIAKYYPFIVTSYDINAYRFYFEYLCTEDTEITVTLKAINTTKTEVISNDYTITFSKGEGSKSLDFYRTLNTQYYYYIVLLYNGQIIAGKYW